MHIPTGARVLHVGSGTGDLLAALEPESGLGLDLSPKLVEMARERHAGLRFEVADPELFELDETFDFVVLDSAVADLGDIQSCLGCIRRVCRPETRLIMSHYNALWEPLLNFGSAVGLRRPTGRQNWLGPEDFQNLLHLTGLQHFDQRRQYTWQQMLGVIGRHHNTDG